MLAAMKWAMVAAVLLLAGCASGNKRGEAYVKAHPELSAELKRRIAAGEALPGMTGEQVIAALGGPKDVRRMADGAEYWEYSAAWLVFRGGVLEGWVDKKDLY